MKFPGLLDQLRRWFVGSAQEGPGIEPWTEDIAAAEEREWLELVASAARQREERRRQPRPAERRERRSARG